MHPEVSTSDTANIHLGFRFPARYTYSFFDFGIQPGGTGKGLQAGLGLGGRVRLPHDLFLDIDLATYAAFRGFHSNTPDLLAKLRATFGWQPYERLAVFGGPTLNTLVELGTIDALTRPGPYQWSPYDYASDTDRVRVRVWPGFVAGVRF